MKEHYLSIKKQLVEQVSELELVDWYLQQEKSPGQIVGTPVAYIQLMPINWESFSMDVQRADIKYRIHLMSQTAHGDDSDMIDVENIDHLGIETKIHIALNGFAPNLDFILRNGDLNQLMDSSTRTFQSVHSEQSAIIHTYQDYTCSAYDYSALPEHQEVLAALDLTVCFQPSITVEVEA